MPTHSTNEAKTHFSGFLGLDQRESVRVTSHDGVVNARNDTDRLKNTIAKTTTAAEQAGLTTELLEQLLANES